MSQVFITGGAKRIGKSLAIAFAKEGYDVAIHYNRSQDEANEVVKELKTLGVFANAYQADLSNIDESESMFKAVLNDFPHLNTIINSASVFKKSTLKECSIDECWENFVVHLFSPLKMLQLFTQQRASGVVVNLIDSKIISNHFERAPYLLAKKSLAEMTKMAALEFAPHFRVNGISPGFVLEPSDATKQFTSDINPLERKNDIESIISTVMFLVKNQDITGEIINVDGGAGL